MEKLCGLHFPAFLVLCVFFLFGMVGFGAAANLRWSRNYIMLRDINLNASQLQGSSFYFQLALQKCFNLSNTNFLSKHSQVCTGSGVDLPQYVDGV